MKKISATLSTIFLLSACAGLRSTYVFKENSENSSYAPFWTVQSTAHKLDPSDEARQHLYFVGEAQESILRSCLKKAETQAVIKTASVPAGKIISRFLKIPRTGKRPDTAELKEKMEQNILTGLPKSVVIKEYWERREYLKEKGAKKDYTAYQCNVVVKLGKNDLAEAVEAYRAKIDKSLSGQNKKDLNKAIDYYVAGLKR